MRRASSTLVLAPLLLLGSLAGHATAYVLTEPDGADRAALLARTGHGYLAWAPAVVGTAVLALVAALALRALGAARGVASRGAHPLLALVPLAAFTAQEVTERAVGGVAPSELLSDRAFLAGLLVQVVCGLIALALSRVLVEGAEELGRLARRRPPLVVARIVPSFVPASAEVVRARAVACPHSGRAPPTPSS